MAQHAKVSLTTSATVVAGNGIHGVIRVTVRNRSTGTAYFGGSDVTTAGFPLTTADNHVDLVVVPGEILYGTSTGACVLDVLRMNETT
jgi:hypothetical protein